MSAAMLDDYTSVKSKAPSSPTKKHQKNLYAERARILETAALKAQNKTLTLQETTDLFARFNQTYEATYTFQDETSENVTTEDESWALKLLEECAKENETEHALQTRVNGVPQVKKALKQVSNTREEKTSSALNSEQNYIDSLLRTTAANSVAQIDAPFSSKGEQKKPGLKLKDAFIYEQFNLQHNHPGLRSSERSNLSFWIFLSISSALTLCSLLLISQFM